MVAPPGTNTEGGTVITDVALLPIATLVPPLGAALEMVTVQLVVPDGATLVLAHCKEETVIGPATDIVTVWLDPFSEAVTTAL